MIFINRSTMSSIGAPHITINTPFTIDESILTGFDYTITPIEYIRNAVGVKITNNISSMPKRFHAYNNDLATVASDMNIKLLSLNEINITADNTMEYLSFLITINNYTITPKETLTAEQELNFRTGIDELLSRVRSHTMRSFFITESLTEINLSNEHILLNNNRISLPNIYIRVDEELNIDDNLKIIRYIDECTAFYREQYGIYHAADEEEEYSDNWAVPYPYSADDSD